MAEARLRADQLFTPITDTGPVIVAVSGGSDSMALLFLANSWALRTGRELHAATIDHGLRPEAAAEAAFVATVCETIAVPHTTLAWGGVKPATGISQSARHARYQLLEEFAAAIDVGIVLSGHTADDQAETVAMRLKRASEPGRGLAGMNARTLLPGGTILWRPMLGVAREELRAYLQAISQSWIEDPSNADTAFERVRVRQRLAAQPELKARLTRFASLMTRARAVTARDAGELLTSSVACTPGPVFAARRDDLLAAPDAVATLAVQTVVAAAGGGEHLIKPRSARQIIDQLRTGERFRTNVGRCVVEAGKGPLRVFREARNLPTTVVEDGERILWDGRLHVANSGGRTITVGPPSPTDIERMEADRGGRLPVLPRRALAAMPVLRTVDGRLHPVLIDAAGPQPGLSLAAGARAIEHYCPACDGPLMDWISSIDATRTSRRRTDERSQG